MSILNVNLSFLAYEDGPATNNPRIRTADVTWSLQGLSTDKVRNIPISLAPGEALTIASTIRSLSYSGATSFDVQKTSAGLMRLAASIGQRTGRSYGDATSQWAITANQGLVTATFTGTGTAPTFSTIQVGDQCYLGPAFSSSNQGYFTVVGKTASNIQFLNQYGAPETVTGLLQVYSAAGVQAGDILDLTSTQFAYPNRGAFPIAAVTDTYIEVVNPSVLAEVVTGAASGLSIYPFAYKWFVLAVDHKTLVSLNGDNSQAEVEPDSEGDLVKHPGLMLKRGKTFQVDISNPGLSPLKGFLVLAE